MPYKNFFTKKIKKRLSRGKNAIILICGPTGNGKSWTALSLAEKWDKKFDEKRVAFSGKEFIEILNKNPPIGSCIVMDEAGIALSSRRSMTTLNTLIGFVNQANRKKQYITFFCMPNLAFLDTQLRSLAHYYIEPLNVNRRARTCLAKLLYFSVNNFTGKVYNIYFVHKNKQIRTIAVKAPSEKLIEEYEKKKMIFIDELTRKTYKILKFKDKEEGGLSQAQQKILKLIKKKYSIEKIREELGYTSKVAVYYQIRRIESILGKKIRQDKRGILVKNN